MNYLAHAYLSFNQPSILTGNMISDFVKGRKKFLYPLAIQKGMTLHRAIDDFTDTHPVTKEAMGYFRHDYRLYSGAFIDIVYDHFLANDKNEFESSETLETFCQHTYFSLENNTVDLPEAFQIILPFMKQQNWLYQYQYREGIEKSFGGLVRRAAYLSDSVTAYHLFNKNYEALKDCYSAFFPDLKAFTVKKLAGLSNG